jgi:hypothetical protein
VEITESGIERVPVVESSVLTEEYWETLRNEQRELLRFVRDDEPGTEAAAYYTMDMRLLSRYKGVPGAGHVYPTDFDVPHIVMHNHPYGMTFSLNDFHPFISNANTIIMRAVGNDGAVYSLEKLPDYEAASAIHAFIEAVKKAPDPVSDIEEYIRYTEKTYTAMLQYGFVYRKG